MRYRGIVIWALTALAMSTIIAVEYSLEGSVSGWLIFVWLYNINFLLYSIFNDGKLILDQSDRVNNSKLSDFHFFISFNKFIMIAGLILLELTELANTYIYALVLTILAVDSTMIIFIRGINKLSEKSVK